MLGGGRLYPEPFPLSPPPPGGEPQGDSLLNILSLEDMTLYIVTFEIKTSYDKAI